MVTGIVLVNVERPRLKDVIKKILELSGVSEVYTVAGEFDLVTIIRVGTNKELSDIVANKMPHEIEGITHTKTLVSLDVNSKINFKELYKA